MHPQAEAADTSVGEPRITASAAADADAVTDDTPATDAATAAEDILRKHRKKLALIHIPKTVTLILTLP